MRLGGRHLVLHPVDEISRLRLVCQGQSGHARGRMIGAHPPSFYSRDGLTNRHLCQGARTSANHRSSEGSVFAFVGNIAGAPLDSANLCTTGPTMAVTRTTNPMSEKKPLSIIPKVKASCPMTKENSPLGTSHDPNR